MPDKSPPRRANGSRRDPGSISIDRSLPPLLPGRFPAQCRARKRPEVRCANNRASGFHQPTIDARGYPNLRRWPERPEITGIAKVPGGPIRRYFWEKAARHPASFRLPRGQDWMGVNKADPAGHWHRQRSGVCSHHIHFEAVGWMYRCGDCAGRASNAPEYRGRNNTRRRGRGGAFRARVRRRSQPGDLPWSVDQ